MAISEVVADLTGKGWEVFIPFGRTNHANLVAITPDAKVVPIECRSVIVDEGEDHDTLYVYPELEITTVLAAVDNRDGTVFYVRAEDIEPDPEVDDEPADVHGVRVLGQLAESGELIE